MKEKDIQLKRTHAKPYKVGKLYFGRSGTARGSSWIASRHSDLSDPLESFEVGKQARAYCEDVRDMSIIPRDVVSAEVDVNIPAGTGLVSIFDEVSDNKII